ncbi:Hypothetical protein CAP_5167 [Chondromyces apiculatus DSM 436]|uniref:STAS/SEC14 domain-containing protein n=1 Tax=Chondromyces apiculatus DSM 436 TaxID=1192034 RepID=A0A017T412_9BACT|nr:Hypothetical protein CAP_5167 [Chondromyces apiculatus DSM 436]
MAGATHSGIWNDEGFPGRRKLLETTPPDGWQYLGAHRIRVEPPDLIRIEFLGDISAREMSTLGDIFLECVEEMSWVMVSADLRRLGDMASETRRAAAQSPSMWHIHGSVVWGANLHQRLITWMTWHAMTLIRRGKHIPLLQAVVTEAEAEAWVARQRQERAARLAGNKDAPSV